MSNKYLPRYGQFSSAFRRYAYSPFTQRANFFLKIAKNIICSLFFLSHFIIPHSIFSNYCPFIVVRQYWMWNFRYAYSNFLMRTWRKREKNPCIHGECAKRICAHIEKKHKESKITRGMREKNLCVHRECRKRIYAYMEKTQNNNH
jgi:hypothetical protein